MREILLLAAAFAAHLTGFGLLALSQPRHRESVGAIAAPGPVGARAAAALLILLALPACVTGSGAAFGAIAWMLLAMAAALAVTFILAWWPHRLLPLARIASAFLPPRAEKQRLPP